MTGERPPSTTPPSGEGAPDDPTASAKRQDDAEAVVNARRIRELRATTGRLGEQVAAVAAQLVTVVEQLEQTGRRHTDLAAAVSEDLAPRVSALQQLVTDEFGRLRGEVDVLLSERQEQDKTKNPPVDWASLSAEQAAEQWPILARWVGEVLVPRYELTRDELPDCWALHPPVVAELSWLRTAYVQAYLTRSPPQLSADWHTRWRPAVLTRIRELIKPDECSPGKHAPRRGTPIDLAAQNGALPRTQLAEPTCWWPFYDRAFHLDLALRRARAAAGELDWSPCRRAPDGPVVERSAQHGSRVVRRGGFTLLECGIEGFEGGRHVVGVAHQHDIDLLNHVVHGRVRVQPCVICLVSAAAVTPLLGGGPSGTRRRRGCFRQGPSGLRRW